MTRLTSHQRRTTEPTCTGLRWRCPKPGCDHSDDTAWTRIGAWVQQRRHRKTHR